MNIIKRAREEGLPLRVTYLVMLTLSIAISLSLLVMAYRTIRSFHGLSAATDSYIELDDAAHTLLTASDYLTEEAQCYTVLGEREHLDNYLAEAERSRRREQSVEIMQNHLPDTLALQELKNAMRDSVSLMDREYYAMRLMMEAVGDTDIPEAMRNVKLEEAHETMSAAAKRTLAARMMHDTAYYTQKDAIRSHLSGCLEELRNGTHGTQEDMEARMHLDLVWVAVLIVAQSLVIVILLWLTTTQGINPLLRAVDHIRRDQSLPIIGAHEFRYLANTYNRMYIAYKRSIENLSFKASHDELTGVYNRAGYDLIKQSVDLSTTAFLLFDADRFKSINDQNGHEVGDLVLQKIASTLKRNFRSDDYVCRIGGDEFVVLMVHVDTNARMLIDHKVRQINDDLAHNADGLPAISLSAGVSLCRENATSQEMFRQADIALYHVKENGRKGCCFYDENLAGAVSGVVS